MRDSVFCVNLYESTNLKCSFSEEYNLVSDTFPLEPRILKNDMFDCPFTSKPLQSRNCNGFEKTFIFC